MRWAPMQWPLGLLLVVVASVAPIDAARAADAVGSIEQVDTEEGSVTFAAQDLPAGARLDPSTIRVTVDGSVVPAEVSHDAVVRDSLPERVAVLAVDTSGSMHGTRISEARRAALAFLDAVPTDVQVGLVSFAGSAKVAVRPTKDRVAVRSAINGLRAEGETSLYDGIVAAAGVVRGEGERSIVVLSDGADTTSRSTAADAIDTIRGAGVSAHFVLYQASGPSAAALERIAAATDARVQPASDARQLAGTFATAARAFDQRTIIRIPALEELGAGRHVVAVSADFEAVVLKATQNVNIAAPIDRSVAQPQAPVTTVTSAAEVSTTPTLLLVLGLVFIAFVALACVFLVPSRPSRTARRFQELQSYTIRGNAAQNVPAPQDEPVSIAQTVLQLSNRFVQRRGMTDRIALQLDRADVRLRPHEWIVIRACATITGAVVCAMVTGSYLVGGVVGSLLGLTVPAAVLRIRARRRLKAFAEQLPDGLQLVASSLQSGFSLPQALDSAARDGRAPLASELARALNEARLGSSLEDALDRVADRMDSKDFRWAVMAVRIQREVGGNLADVLRTTVATIRERAALHRQVRALSAEGRLSMYILMALPIGMFTFLATMRGEYARILWTEPLGLLMSVAALLSMTIGYFWMRAVIRVEV